MCVAIVKPAGEKLPSRETLKICFKNNPDGAGFAYNRNGKNYLHKGYFTFADFYNDLTKCKIKKNESALIHFRVATHGNVDKHTCHPFLITGCFDDMKITHLKTEGNIMIHNGMLSFFTNDETISDSMILAKQLYKLNLKSKVDKTFVELALRNNDKLKMNRLAILYRDNTTEMFGFKEPWELFEGCYFSNKSYEKTFVRGYKYSTTNNNENEDKFNYDENEIQSKKVSFCHNHDHGCNELSVYCVHNGKKDVDEYCENCIDNISLFNCKYCGCSYYSDKESKIKGMCIDCYTDHKTFIEESKCSCGHIGNHVVYYDKDKYDVYCDNCFTDIKTFVCSECGKVFYTSMQSNIENLCNYCIDSKKGDECLYCKSKQDLIRTTFSTICKKCFKEKSGKVCFTCGRKFIYGNNNIDDLNFCSKCFSTFSYEKVLECFESFKMLKDDLKKEIINSSKNMSDKIKKEILILYKNNNLFSKIKENYNVCMKIIKEHNKEKSVK